MHQTIRFWIRTWVIVSFVLSSCSIPAQEFRGIWVDALGPGFQTKEEVTQLVEDCRKYNFNAVFVQMRARGDAFYFPQKPNADPRAVMLGSGYDALAEILRQCHTGSPRIEVHCWVVGYYVWGWQKPPAQPEHIFNRHPEYLTTDSIGQKWSGTGYYLDPGHPAAMQTLHDTAIDIVSRYEIDGLHWDYLRYPAQDSGYNKVAIKRYQDEFGIREIPLPSDPKFSEWRRRQVTDTMRWITVDVLEIKPKLIISASVFSNYGDSRDYRFQDWVAWNQEGIVDVTVPMDFSTNNRFVFNPRADFAFTNQGIRTTYLGQGGFFNTKENTLTQLTYAREKGFKGTAFYSYRVPILPSENVNQNPAMEPTFSSDAGIIVDNLDAEMIGSWQTVNSAPGFRTNYFYTKKGGGAAFFRFKPELPRSGFYGVYEWHAAGENRASDAPFEIRFRDGTNTVKVNQQRNGARWNFLGTYPFAKESAEVRITDAIEYKNQIVIADAVRFVWIDQNNAKTLSLQKSVDPAEAAQRASQEDTFAFLRKNYQPTWKNVPALPWKKNPTKGIIKGRVTNQSNGQPVYNAVISLETSATASQQTEPHGTFAFFEIDPGEYTLKAASGSATFSMKIRVKAGEIASVNMPLTAP